MERAISDRTNEVARDKHKKTKNMKAWKCIKERKREKRKIKRRLKAKSSIMLEWKLRNEKLKEKVEDCKLIMSGIIK